MVPCRKSPSDPARQSTPLAALAAAAASLPSLPATALPSLASNCGVLTVCSDGNLGSTPESPARLSWRADSAPDLCSGADCPRASSGRCWRDHGSRTAVTEAVGGYPGRTDPWAPHWGLSGARRRPSSGWKHGESGGRCFVGVVGLVKYLTTEETPGMRESRDHSGPCANPARKETRCASPI